MPIMQPILGSSLVLVLVATRYCTGIGKASPGIRLVDQFDLRILARSPGIQPSCMAVNYIENLYSELEPSEGACLKASHFVHLEESIWGMIWL
jgi:hypothetical protein